MNLFDEMKRIKAFHGTNYNHEGSLTNVHSEEQLTEGWWSITADEDFYVRGPSAASAAADDGDAKSRFCFAKQEVILWVPEDYYVSIIRDDVDGTWHMNMLAEN